METARTETPVRAASTELNYLPLLFLDGSTSFHGPPLGVGGSVLPLGTVVSAPPFAGRYWPDFGAGLPGFVGLDFATRITSCPSAEQLETVISRV
jgi:hypothetical protein